MQQHFMCNSFMQFDTVLRRPNVFFETDCRYSCHYILSTCETGDDVQD
jgi:hypothetical protein